jgi:hypothetical protein
VSRWVGDVLAGIARDRRVFIDRASDEGLEERVAPDSHSGVGDAEGDSSGDRTSKVAVTAVVAGDGALEPRLE